MSRGRPTTFRMTPAAMRQERDEIGFRTGRLLERYHALEVLPLRVRLEWREKWWFVRLFLWMLGKKPDADAIVAARMEELDAQVILPCTAMRNDLPCELEHGHGGPHKRRVRLAGSTEVFEWEDAKP